ncbi:alpha/beta-hydrolase [Lentinula aciculospora]|uniref:triacylglycerol lipase n=1 Tax=Lentinula aciculospora TaxID=153920 RepID=A0A9W9DW52_9AGAR|nr:alpha/beta-hydrolase [Lentinula aciculospora]
MRPFSLLLSTILLSTFFRAPFVSIFVNAQRGQVLLTHQHELLPQTLSEEALDAVSRASIDDHSTLILPQSPTPTLSNSKLNLDLHLKTRPTAVYRPSSLDAFHEGMRITQHRRRDRTQTAEQKTNRYNVNWDIVHLDGPDVQDLHTLAQLARMSGNAYALGSSEKNWYELDQAWNISFPFGFEDAQDGFRGHVFLSADNSTIVLAIKGTTLQGPTSKKDKFNDNLLFSCCCARVDFSWVFRQVCDCYSGSWNCDNTCLSDALVEDSLFYTVGVNLVNDLRTLYPSANIWLVGHSLGGALASLLGSTFGLPAVAFESPGERLAAERLGLPIPPGPNELLGSLELQVPSELDSDILPEILVTPSLSPTVHVYHTADPIPQGTCTGPFSPCSQTGYALETHCHLGKSIVFDTVTELGWRVDVRKHPIKEVVGVMEMWGQEEDVRKPEREGRKKRKVPEAQAEVDCVDCYKWDFGDFKDKGL